MSNLTITVDSEVLKQARILALQAGSSVNQMLGAYLRTATGDQAAQNEAMAEIEAMSNDPSVRHSGARMFNREDLHLRY